MLFCTWYDCVLVNQQQSVSNDQILGVPPMSSTLKEWAFAVLSRSW